MKQQALAQYQPEEYLPGPSVGDDDASLAKAAGDIGTTIFHPVGTAKMGTANDPIAVVDERLRFHGIAGLRVADASVMPTITSGNTNTPTAMIAEKAAAMILEDARYARRHDRPASHFCRHCRRAHRADAMGRADSGKPPALLVHGTGFVAEVWDEVARGLAANYTVYALDRRGHGASHKPAADRYHFLDFADDLSAGDRGARPPDIFGIGHSAGATDLLLAAKLLPRRFSRLFVMEPTVMDPRAARTGPA